MMTWAPVADCLGRPEMVAGYAVMLMAVWVVSWYECEGGLCPIYAHPAPVEVGFTQETRWTNMPVPSVGGVDIYEVVAVDEAGNRSEDCP